MANTTKPKKAVVAADFYVGFSGAAAQVNLDEPALGEQVEYTVLGTVRNVGESIRDDGETRMAIKVDVEAAWPKGSARPENANQSLMFDHDGKPTADAAGTNASADEGDEIVAERDEAKAAAADGKPDEYDQDDPRNS